MLFRCAKLIGTGSTVRIVCVHSNALQAWLSWQVCRLAPQWTRTTPASILTGEKTFHAMMKVDMRTPWLNKARPLSLHIGCLAGFTLHQGCSTWHREQYSAALLSEALHAGLASYLKGNLSRQLTITSV